MPPKSLSRRDFLKLISVIPASIAIKSLTSSTPSMQPDRPHVIVLVFDACSANNLSLYGYQRPTTPNLDQFAEKSTVFHRHYSTASFTVPGTASLLTSLYPWTHRALNLGGSIKAQYQEDQIFAALSGSHATVGWAQNTFADMFLYQAGHFLQNHIPIGSFNRTKEFIYSLPVFNKDAFLAFSSIEGNIFQRGQGVDGSLFLGPLKRFLDLRERKLAETELGSDYADGLPDSLELFTLSGLVDGAIKTLKELAAPSLVYLHFYPPHELYRPTYEFYEQFKTGWQPINKAVHPLSQEKETYGSLKSTRILYDEYLASWDAELARLFEYFDQSGLREKSYILITSDHGQLFERGESGHMSSLLYEPIMHVPLIVSRPQDQTHIEVNIPTSSVDVLPTIAHLTGNPIPTWAEGQLLPTLGGNEDPSRSIYTMDAKTNAAFGPLTKFSISLTKGNQRLTHYQYPDYNSFEFYDLAKDPEEMTDLYPSKPAAAVAMESELVQKIAEINTNSKK
jgi:arylsulfatase A-like enzyme